MRQWRNGAGNAPRHYAGTRSATGRVLSRTRSLTAAAIAVAMMATVAVTSLLPTYNAKADESRNDGAICTPTTEPLGDQTSGSGNDEGIATFVGGDMYVGGKKSGITSANNNNAPEGSYAVEAEGLTAVNGKLLLHPMKQAWNIWNEGGSFNRSRGFRWGIVGFGSQFRPKDGSTVLSVGGNSTNSELDWFGGAQGWTDDANQGSSWLGTGAGNGATGETNDHNFNANIAGNQTTVQSRNTWKNGEQYSVYDMGGNGKVNWNQSNTVISGVKNPSTGSDYTYSEYKNYVTTLSGKLAKISSSNTVMKGNEDNYTGKRYSYSYNTYANNVYWFDIENNSRQTEITLTGDGKDELQVFNLDASKLNSIDDAGVVFNFKNISDNASVAININGNGNDVKFRNGWQFKWNDVDISDGYVMMKSTGGNRYDNEHGQDYVKRASQLMWNFYNTNTLTILGGKGSGHINTGWYENQNHGDKEDWDNVNVTDDPSAAWMGSVMVTGNDSGAAGNFQSHVSTNGRVWTTGDFEMYNKDVVTTSDGKKFVNAEGKNSTSAVDMDQERHNLPWYGTFNSSCAVIQINKVDSSKKALAGTTWGVFKSYADAKAGTNALRVVKDGGAFDLDDTDNGTIQIGSLNPNATYYLKEIASASGYQVSDKVYQITAGAGGSIAQDVKESSDGTTWTAVADNRIVNEKKGASLEWPKVDGSDSSKVLSGSEWQLTTSDGKTAYRITDSTKSVTSVKIYHNGEVPSRTITMTDGIPFDLTASVFGTDNKTDGVPQGVAWTATGSVVVDDNGKVTAVNDGNGTVTACSLAATKICATVKVNVPNGTIIKPTPKNSTTFYFKAEGYNSGSTKLHYSFTPDNTSSWKDAVMTSAEGCSDWLSATIENPDLKAVTYLFYQDGNWYHQGNSTTANFVTTAGQTVVAVKDHLATVTAPSGCSTGGGSTTTGSVTIRGDTYEVGLNKTITLTATPTPSSDTVTWYSGNTSVASVTAGPDTTTTIKGLKAGTTTITAKTSSGATASVTITVKDDSTVNVYFKKSTVNWGDGNYYLHYQPKTGTSWPAVKMTDAGDCSDYVVASIPKVDVVANHGYYFRNGVSPRSSGWYNSNGQNMVGEPFTFWDGTYTDMYVNTNSDKQRGKPRGCSVTSSAAKVKARVSAAMLKSNKTDVIAVNDAEGSGTSAAPIVYSCGDAKGKCDMNTEPGKFRVVDLADGAYTLTETVAPNGYTAGGSYTVTIANGTVTITDASENAIAGNEIPNARNTGAISWNKVSSDSQNNEKLGGSEWKLTKTANFVWNTDGKAEYTGIAEDKQLSIPITDCKLREGKTCSAPADGQTIYDVDPVEGQFKLEGLEWGTYTLVETKAPDGYDVDSTVRTFTFGPVSGSDGTDKWNSNGVASAAGDATGNFTTSPANYDSSVFNFSVGGIKNQPGVVLPATGGEGLNKMYAAGFLAVAIAVAGLALSLRRRQ